MRPTSDILIIKSRAYTAMGCYKNAGACKEELKRLGSTTDSRSSNRSSRGFEGVVDPLKNSKSDGIMALHNAGPQALYQIVALIP